MPASICMQKNRQFEGGLVQPVCKKGALNPMKRDSDFDEVIFIIKKTEAILLIF